MKQLWAIAMIFAVAQMVGCAAKRPVKAKLKPNQANCSIEAVDAKSKAPTALHCLWGDGSESFWVRQ